MQSILATLYNQNPPIKDLESILKQAGGIPKTRRAALSKNIILNCKKIYDTLKTCSGIDQQMLVLKVVRASLTKKQLIDTFNINDFLSETNKLQNKKSNVFDIARFLIEFNKKFELPISGCYFDRFSCKSKGVDLKNGSVFISKTSLNIYSSENTVILFFKSIVKVEKKDRTFKIYIKNSEFAELTLKNEDLMTKFGISFKDVLSAGSSEWVIVGENSKKLDADVSKLNDIKPSESDFVKKSKFIDNSGPRCSESSKSDAVKETKSSCLKNSTNNFKKTKSNYVEDESKNKQILPSTPGNSSFIKSMVTKESLSISFDSSKSAESSTKKELEIKDAENTKNYDWKSNIDRSKNDKKSTEDNSNNQNTSKYFCSLSFSSTPEQSPIQRTPPNSNDTQMNFQSEKTPKSKSELNIKNVTNQTKEHKIDLIKNKKNKNRNTIKKESINDRQEKINKNIDEIKSKNEIETLKENLNCGSSIDYSKKYKDIDSSSGNSLKTSKYNNYESWCSGKSIKETRFLENPFSNTENTSSKLSKSDESSISEEISKFKVQNQKIKIHQKPKDLISATSIAKIENYFSKRQKQIQLEYQNNVSTLNIKRKKLLSIIKIQYLC